MDRVTSFRGESCVNAARARPESAWTPDSRNFGQNSNYSLLYFTAQIFASSGNEVRGYTKKGKLFLGFDTNMTDAISSMSITGNELCVAGTHVYNHYTDCKDANSFLSEAVITDVLALPGEKVISAY